ncbi:MAG: hypothetical protein E7295_04785 [Lachnospiraceae bacterium]|jgi:putative protease|nr:hypothetical protein [Lachnospiraceae bacterium]
MVNKNPRTFRISLRSREQLEALLEFTKSRHLDFEVTRIYLFSDFIMESRNSLALCEELKKFLPNAEWILSLPEILREGDEAYLGRVKNYLLQNKLFSGVLVGNLEGLGYFSELSGLKIYGDHSLYLWNSGAVEAFHAKLNGGCIPLELRAQEQKSLLSLDFDWDKIVYGRIPMMVTANCLAKTTEGCQKSSGKRESVSLIDRMGKHFPVLLNCEHCYNVIYNTVSLSLHGELWKYEDKASLRLQMTMEGKEEAIRIFTYFLTNHADEQKPPFQDYTTGHEKRGVE